MFPDNGFTQISGKDCRDYYRDTPNSKQKIKGVGQNNSVFSIECPESRVGKQKQAENWKNTRSIARAPTPITRPLQKDRKALFLVHYDTNVLTFSSTSELENGLVIYMFAP